MHAEQAQRLPSRHDDVGELLHLLARLRWRLGFERAVVFALRGLVGSGVVLIAISVTAWLTRSDTFLWLCVAPFGAALAIAVARWPSQRHAALAADRRLGLAERLGTAAEIVQGHEHSGRFDQLQVRDAIGHARAAPNSWLILDRRTRNEAVLAAGVLVLAVASLVLPALPGPGAATDRGSAPADLSALPEIGQRAVPDDLPDVPLASAQPVQQTQSDADLAARVQQAQAERTALDALARALSSVSAGQAAADAIQQGNFTVARDQLQTLGEEADQLSSAAKQQLAKALQQAAAATTQADRQLADRERQAAQALGRTTYADQRQALRALADQVERSGARSVPADQLERDLGRLQQQTGGAPGAPGQSVLAASSSSAGQPGAGQVDAAASQSSAVGASDGGAQGQSGAGVGTGADPDVFGNQPARLDSAGQTVQVPTKLGNGPGVRPPDGTEDQTGADPAVGRRSVSELARGSQQTGQVAPEQNLVPGEQRPVVRGYFR